MRLGDFIEKKKAEIMESGMRSVDFDTAYECEIGKHSVSFMLFSAEKVPEDTEVEEVNRSVLPDDYSSRIPAITVTFKVVKPRCRNAVRQEFYVKAV